MFLSKYIFFITFSSGLPSVTYFSLKLLLFLKQSTRFYIYCSWHKLALVLCMFVVLVSNRFLSLLVLLFINDSYFFPLYSLFQHLCSPGLIYIFNYITLQLRVLVLIFCISCCLYCSLLLLCFQILLFRSCQY